jgi:ABC-type glycerol-3-phosphate transport system substrate-binding protein
MRAALAALLALLLTLAACGGEDEIPEGLGQANETPVARLSLPSDARAGQPVLLDGASSTDDTAVQMWWFDPGDGSPLLRASSPQLYHTYQAPGAYTVTLSVLDDTGTKDTDRGEIIVR